MDRNTDREATLLEIGEELVGYDELLTRSDRVSSLETPQPQHVESLQNWPKGNGCIARDETEFFHHANDLITLSSPDDVLVSWLERLVSRTLVILGKRSQPNISKDPNVYIYSKPSTNSAARTLLTPFIICVLLAPVAICNAIGNPTGRLLVVTAATTVFVMALSLLTKSKVVELAVAGATYSTVLIAFIAGPNYRFTPSGS
ncbi:hypothetical protein B0T24DRAFT_631648 [Lasiosphaeria ovina]|uniref:DUF6594 domain-containing protein n=1 Tax=Lasiosphaeria ovina TaxID=92902 RepID=A0AAE0K3S4_9PEZI|nr:hypothetical protein B0T24DRAFT_631648 [Lasiosphaeria ovina]